LEEVNVGMQIACIAYMGPNQSGVAVMARIIPQQK